MIRFFVILTVIFLANFAQAQKNGLKQVTTIGLFDGKKFTVGNFETDEVYKINEYFISLNSISPKQVDSLKGKKIIVTGNLKIVEGKNMPAKSGNNGKIYEPYKEPDKRFIENPVFKIYYETREPLIEK